MDTSSAFTGMDYAVFFAYFVVLSLIGLWAGRKEKKDAGDYFLAGRSLPWYAVGGSFVASNISSEHFIGMIGAVYIYGICVALSEWRNIWVVSMLVWFFIPFLLSSKVFTTPEFLEKRFSPVLRQFFAVVTIISNVVAFLAAVLYGGALAIQKLFQEELTKLTSLLPAALSKGSGISGFTNIFSWSLSSPPPCPPLATGTLTVSNSFQILCTIIG